jgi:hypothetical protein
MAITLTNSIIREYVEYCGHPRPGDGRLHLGGFRGSRRYPADGVVLSLVEPIPNSYDDQVIAFGLDLLSYTGTLDPGRFYSQHPMRPKEGCAHIVCIDEPSGKPCNYKRGLHRGKSPAFVQDGAIVVWRDRDRDMGQDPNEVARTEGHIGLNGHRMGTIRADIGKWSAGCWGTMDKYWQEFWKRTALTFPQESYSFYPMDFALFAKWYDTERG